MSDATQSFLIVDGNNVIYAWPELASLRRNSGDAARKELRRILASYADFADERVVLVFDGRRAGTTEERDPGGLQIFYSGAGVSADAVIERLAASYASRYAITVASDDRAEQDMVVAAGGAAISTSALRERIERGRRGLEDWLSRHRRR